MCHNILYCLVKLVCQSLHQLVPQVTSLKLRLTGRVRRRFPLSEDEDEDNTDGSSLDANTSDVSLFDSNNSKKRKKVEKCSNDSIPLPNPFPLPKHFRCDVEVALETKQLTRDS